MRILRDHNLEAKWYPVKKNYTKVDGKNLRYFRHFIYLNQRMNLPKKYFMFVQSQLY